MSGGAPKETTQTTKVEYSPEEAAARQRVMEAALGTYDAAKAGGPQQYMGAKPVEPGAMTLQGQNMMAANAMQQQGQIAKTQGANNFAMSDALYSESNPYLQSAMNAATRPMMQQFGEAGGALSNIREGAQVAGGYGGSRAGIAEGIATRGLQDKVGDMRANMSNANYQNALMASQSAIKNQGLLSMLSQLPGQTMGQIGAQQDGFSQQQENYRATRDTFNQQQDWAPLQNLANIIYGGSNGTTTSSAMAPQQDNTAAYVGSAASLAMMAAMMT